MFGIIGSLVVGGVAGYVIKDKITPASDDKTSNPQELNSLYSENEKLAKRNKELERENEDLLAELQKVRRSARTDSNDMDDMEDKLESAQHEAKSLRKQNDVLAAKLKEYKTACESLEAQIAAYKAKQ